MTGLTEQQRAERRNGMTATDLPAILGLHPYRTAIDVWLEKMGEDVASVDDPRLRWGLLLEQPVREDYARRRGARVWVPGTLTHRTEKHHKATPDGIVFVTGGKPYVLHASMSSPEVAAGAERGLEIKSHSVRVREHFGEPGTDEVPEHHLIQCAWNMHVVNLPRWDLVAFIDGLPADYTIERDAELEDILVEAADRFWRDHVVTRRPPPPDGSRQYTEWLRKRWPGRGPAVQAYGASATAMNALRVVRTKERSLAQERAYFEQVIQTAMGDAEAIELDGERITWKRCKDSVRVDWEAAFGALSNCVDAVQTAYINGAAPEEIIPALMETDAEAIKNNNTKTTPGARQFCVPRAWHKEDE